MGAYPPALAVYLTVLAALLGLCMGSFCNAWAWRLVHGESILKGRSHCARCARTLTAPELVPLVSYFVLRGRCRGCGAPISRRYPAIEAVSAVFFVSMLLRYGLTLSLLRLLVLGCLLLVLSLVDWDTREIPDRLLLAGTAAALLRLPEEGLSGLKDGILGAVALSLSLLLLVLLADKRMGRETMGGGDIKLLFVLGLHFGPARTLLLLIAACALGLLGALAGRKRFGEGIPFGPFLSGAAWLTALFGAQFLQWYLSLFGL